MCVHAHLFHCVQFVTPHRPLVPSVHGISQARILELGCHSLLPGIEPRSPTLKIIYCRATTREAPVSLEGWKMEKVARAAQKTQQRPQGRCCRKGAKTRLLPQGRRKSDEARGKAVKVIAFHPHQALPSLTG